MSQFDRREFLGWIGASATLTVLSACGNEPAANPQQQRNSVSIAVFRPTARGFTLQIIPGTAVDARILAGTSPSELTLHHEQRIDQTTEIVLDAFSPGTEIHWQCQFKFSEEEEWVSSAVQRVRTAKPPGEEFHVAMLADAHLYRVQNFGQSWNNIAKTNRAVIEDRPDFAIFLGDEAGVFSRSDRPGTMNQLRAMSKWERWRNTFSELLASVPTYMVLGNHEGEAGFHQSYSHGNGTSYYQRWATIARKRFFLNPLPETYPEGGENEGWQGDQSSAATGGAVEGNRSPLQNYFAWSWGDSLFVVIDCHRYTKVGGSTPASVDDWTLGEEQFAWFEHVLTTSKARWKFVVAHHLVGGWDWDIVGLTRDTGYKYGRGGGRYARDGEQSRITDVMKRAGSQFFLYGHDHVFCHQEAEGIHFICCGRTSFLNGNRWWKTPGWVEAYGDVGARNPHDFHAAIGFTRLRVSPTKVDVEYVRTGTDANRAENVDGKEGEILYTFTQT